MSLPVIHVVGVGFAGARSLSPERLSLICSATLLVGGQRHLSAFDTLEAAREIQALPLADFTDVFEKVRSHLKTHSRPQVVILASGDPLFFGIGRLLLSTFSAEQLAFYPHVSAIQLAFSRLKLPWQNATVLSVHGRSEVLLVKALKRGDETIAVLTDGVITPIAIATLITSLDIPTRYQLWVCENLGGEEERVSHHWPDELTSQAAVRVPITTFSPLNVVVLQRQVASLPSRNQLPLVGLPDSAFKGFRDRPSLITKREIRLLIIGELAPLNGQTIWDIGAGTGSVGIELSRLCPQATIYAIEKTAAGAALIEENAQRLAIAPVHIVSGKAPSALVSLPSPARVFIGGSSGQLVPILEYLSTAVAPERIVLAIATLENLTNVLAWAKQDIPSTLWACHLTQANISRSIPIGPLTRFSPLTPITLVTFSRRQKR